MPTDSPLAQILLTRSETQLLFDVYPSAKLQSKLDACDAAISLLRGNPDEFVRLDSIHDTLRTESTDKRVP